MIGSDWKCRRRFPLRTVIEREREAIEEGEEGILTKCYFHSHEPETHVETIRRETLPDNIIGVPRHVPQRLQHRGEETVYLQHGITKSTLS